MIDRIKQLIELLSSNASEFANKTGIQKAQLSHIMSGRNKPSLDIAIKILSTFPHISSDWLLLGTGNMERNQIDDSREITNVNIVNKPEKSPLPEEVVSNNKEIIKIVIFYEMVHSKALNLLKMKKEYNFYAIYFACIHLKQLYECS